MLPSRGTFAAAGRTWLPVDRRAAAGARDYLVAGVGVARPPCGYVPICSSCVYICILEHHTLGDDNMRTAANPRGKIFPTKKYSFNTNSQSFPFVVVYYIAPGVVV